MQREPMGYFGWLMSCCVSDERASTADHLVSTALAFASGMAASGVTLYLAGVLHIL